MRFVWILLIAWIEYALVMPPPAAESPLIWRAAVALGGALVFALVTWFILKFRHPKSSSIAFVPTFVMIGILAFLGFGGAYGVARDNGLDPHSANIDAIMGWPGLFLLVAVVGIVFALKSAKKAPANASD